MSIEPKKTRQYNRITPKVIAQFKALELSEGKIMNCPDNHMFCNMLPGQGCMLYKIDNKKDE